MAEGDKPLAGQSALITGGGGGIGGASAAWLARDGAAVMIMGRTEATLQKAQAAILEAEARLESAKRDADAQVTLAESSAEAIRRVSAAIGNESGAMMFLLGEKYIAAMEGLSKSTNAKTVLIPADIQETLRGVLGKRG